MVREYENVNGPTKEQWAAIRKACERGDLSDVNEIVFDAGLDPRLGRLFLTVVTEFNENEKVAENGKGLEAEKHQTVQRLAMLNRRNPQTTADVDDFLRETTEAQRKCNELTTRMENGRCALIHCWGLSQTFPSLFAVERPQPITHGIPQSVVDELSRLQLTHGRAEPWADLAPAEIPPRPRKTVSASKYFDQTEKVALPAEAA